MLSSRFGPLTLSSFWGIYFRVCQLAIIVFIIGLEYSILEIKNSTLWKCSLHFDQVGNNLHILLHQDPPFCTFLWIQFFDSPLPFALSIYLLLMKKSFFCHVKQSTMSKITKKYWFDFEVLPQLFTTLSSLTLGQVLWQFFNFLTLEKNYLICQQFFVT